MVKKIKHSTLRSFQKLSIIEGTNAYSQLREQVIQLGILDRDYVFYFRTAFIVLSGYLISIYFIYKATDILPLILWSIIFAFFAVQIGGFMHDAGHRSIFKSTKTNDILGYFACALIAIRYKNWKVKHNLHHAHPNQEESDTDIEIPFSFTEDRYKSRKGWKRFIRRHQAFLFYPFGSLVAFSMRITGLRDYKKALAVDELWEKSVFFFGLFAWFVLPFLVFDLSKAVIFIIVSNIAMGLYLMNIFAPNHKGMPELEKGVKLSFVEHQIITSRNIKSNWFVDFVYMGLNYQIEHHLFPNTPRNRLGRITPFVIALCKKMNLEFTTVSVFEQNRIILSELHHVGRQN